MKSHILAVVSLLKNRFILFTVSLLIFSLSYYLYTGSLLPTTETKDLWFYSGLFMVLFSLLFIEPYYTSPKNVITNAIPLLLVFLSIRSSFNNEIFWIAAIIIQIGLIVGSIISLTLEDKNKSPEDMRNRISIFLKDSVTLVGQGKVLYSAVFIYFLLTYYSIQDFYTLILFIFWFSILMINPKSLHASFSYLTKKNNINQIGEIFGVQSKKIFLVKLFEDRKSVRKFEIVKFNYSMQDDYDFVITGIVFDSYLLNQEKWVKVLQLTTEKKEKGSLEKNVVYKISNEQEILRLSQELKIEKLVGVIIDGSNTGKIKFEYSMKEDSLQEGDLLELNVGKRRLFYQVINGSTEKELLEARNETGFIEGEALQLGEWDINSLCFKKFGWVPEINTPVFKTTASDIEVPQLTYPYYELGKIPGTLLPSVINLDDAISHHMALLGITGSGKSFLAREIIKQIQADTKVICIDFNKEFATSITPSPENIIIEEKAKEIAKTIEIVNSEMEKFSNQRQLTPVQLQALQTKIKTLIREQLNVFLDDVHCNIKIFELPDVVNTASILDYTKYFFKVLFEIAKEKQMDGRPAKICIVLEEAHTIIPEWNFSGSGDKTSQSVVNSIGQITLQGRKYGVGFLVIAQRTANVSKTVLTQCNTVICFQAFDETSFSFLGNYVGKDMVQALPNLKKFHAVVAGKSIISNVPMIIDLERHST